jgi:hypothetical protein
VEKPSQDRRSLGCFAFTKSPEDEDLLTLVAHFDIPKMWKTIGVLYRGHQLHSVAAMSGWAHREDPESVSRSLGEAGQLRFVASVKLLDMIWHRTITIRVNQAGTTPATRRSS